MKSRCLLNLALVYEWRGNIAQCAKYIRIAVHLANKHNLIQDLHRCQSSLALVYLKHKLYKLALKSLDGAITSAERLKDKALLCEELLAKSIILINLKDFESARGYLKRAYKVHSPIQEDHEKSAKFLKICIGICNAQMELQDLDLVNITLENHFLRKLLMAYHFWNAII
ncbi:hypothetical protein CEXT_462211 [Caerostris extrusa]|uniref:Uncharacterized protein n=1 Tax=Caerostris extrusa TaxID=172846 RepID=A0AAV4P717_CAEEX|nr:hypothetical protein CEXT_462211 [Caerostris extrusa]